MRTKNNLLVILLASGTIGCLTLLFLHNRDTAKITCEKKGCRKETPKPNDAGGGSVLFDGSLTHLIVSTKQ